MTRLQALGITAAILVGALHGLLALIWDKTVDQQLYPKGWPH